MPRAKEDPEPSTDDTPSRLRRAAHVVVCEVGLAGASARAIAGRAQVNQALIFYHFHTVSELLEAASDDAIADSVDYYRSAFAEVGSVDEVVTVARAFMDRERRVGNVAFMAQILSGAQHDPVLARAARSAVTTWSRQVRDVLDRVLADSPVADLVDTEGLAHLVSAGFIGIELYDVADAAGAARAIDTLETIGGLVGILDDLGPVVRRALVARTRRRHHRTDG